DNRDGGTHDLFRVTPGRHDVPAFSEGADPALPHRGRTSSANGIQRVVLRHWVPLRPARGFSSGGIPVTRSWLYHVGVTSAYSAVTALFMAVAAWPIYQSPSIVWVVVFGAALGGGVISIGMARGWGAFTLTGLVLAFIFTAAPITMDVVPSR